MRPSDKFIDELLQLAIDSSKFGVNPDDEEEYIIDDAVAVEMHPLEENPNYIHFISIRALTPHKGHGTAAMKQVIDLVDRNSITLIGRIIPYHTKDTPVEKLRDWYRKMGCVPVEAAHEDGLWVRAPYGGHTQIKLRPVTKVKILNGYSEEDFWSRKILFSTLVVVGFILLYLKVK